ncbi:MAG: hypothetical protein HYX52_07130 [Chloroflexi bacterium]|nr:hypothetical protein [Chloroflexota bacterium]
MGVGVGTPGRPRSGPRGPAARARLAVLLLAALVTACQPLGRAALPKSALPPIQPELSGWTVIEFVEADTANCANERGLPGRWCQMGATGGPFAKIVSGCRYDSRDPKVLVWSCNGYTGRSYIDLWVWGTPTEQVQLVEAAVRSENRPLDAEDVRALQRFRDVIPGSGAGERLDSLVQQGLTLADGGEVSGTIGSLVYRVVRSSRADLALLISAAG